MCFYSTIDLAEFVLNKCIIGRPYGRRRHCSVEGSNFVDSPSVDVEVHYDFAYLKDTSRPEDHHPNHVLNWMVCYTPLWTGATFLHPSLM